MNFKIMEKAGGIIVGQPAICPLFAGILLLYNRKDGFYNKIKRSTQEQRL